MLPGKSPIQVDPTVVWAELSGESVLLNPVTGIYFGLDAVGTYIWQRLMAGTDEEDLLASLSDAYDVDARVLHADVDQFLGRLAQRGLIVRPESTRGERAA